MARLTRTVSTVCFLTLLFGSATAIAAWHPPDWMESWIHDQLPQDRIDDRLDGLASPFDIVVDFDHTITQTEEDQLALLGNIDFRSKYVNAIWMSNVFDVSLPQILSMPGVLMIEWQAPLEPTLNVSTDAIQATESGYYGSDYAHQWYRGDGMNIAIIDTGVDNWHETLDDMDDNPGTTDPKIVAGMNATIAGRPGGELIDPDDDWDPGFHGTHVAGIALGTNSTYEGVAPEAKLIDVKVCDQTAQPSRTCRNADVTAGIEWCIDNRNTDWTGQDPEFYGIDVINISLGRNADSDGQAAMSLLLNRAVDLGLIVVVAAGNDGASNTGLGPIAAADRVITVANTDDFDTVDRGDDLIRTSSSRGPRSDDGDTDPYDELKPEVAAPGTHIISAEGSVIVEPTSGWTSKTGTSMASPHVAGVAALMLQRDSSYAQNAQLMADVLQCTADDKNGASEPALDPYYDHAYGWGIANAYDAVAPGVVDLWIEPWGDKLSPPQQPHWKSNDIWLDDEPAVKGSPNGINALIHNNTNAAVDDVRVHFSVNNYGASSKRPWIDLGTTTISVGALSTAVARVAWTPAETSHQCIKVTFESCAGNALDADASDNEALENVWPKDSSSSKMMVFGGKRVMWEEWPIELYNPHPQARTITTTIARSSMPVDWSATLALSSTVVGPGDVAEDTLRVFFPEGSSDSGWLDVDVLVGGEAEAVSGVTAELNTSPVGIRGPGLYPQAFRLLPSFPNPFNPNTTIRFDLPRPASVHLAIYDGAGRLVRTLLEGDSRNTGRHTVNWDGRDARGRRVASGVYSVHLEAGTYQATRKLVLVR